MENLKQRMTLFADSPRIVLHVSFDKKEHNKPEAIYFVFPLNLEDGWRVYFDSASTIIELDSEQLPGACRDWFTVESFATMHDNESCFSLISPDAPMVMAGDFNFGRKSDAIPRPANPLLLSWVCNNYWDTNFPQSQPGPKSFRYSIVTTTGHDENTLRKHTGASLNPVIMHPCASASTVSEGNFLQVSGTVEVLSVRKSRDNEGVIVGLLNTADHEETTSIKLDLPIIQAFACDPLERLQEELVITNNSLKIRIPPRRSVSIKLIISGSINNNC